MESQSTYTSCAPDSFTQHYSWNSSALLHGSVAYLFGQLILFHLFIHSSAMAIGMFLDIVHKATVKILI